MAQDKTAPLTARRGIDRWAQVAFLSGKVAAGAGSAHSSNPHPAGSNSARDWHAGWNAHAGAKPAKPIPAKPIPAPGPPRFEGELTMDLLKRLPDLPDADLDTLGINAERLALNGTPKQKTAAQAALPAIQEELAARQARKAAVLAAKGTGRGRKKAAVATAPATAAAQPE